LENLLLYLYIAEKYTLHEAADKRPVLYKAAGIAYDRKGDFVEAEKECLKALHYHRIQLGHGLDLNQATIENTITFLLHLYDKQDKCDVLDTFVLVLTGLLYKAGFETTPGDISHMLVFQCGSKVASLLFPRYRTQQGAKNALLLAMESSSIEHFHSAVSQCMPVQFHAGETPAISPAIVKRYHEDEKKEQLQRARSGVDVVCANPACTFGRTGGFKGCPCKYVKSHV
jgi:hypothetical protein